MRNNKFSISIIILLVILLSIGCSVSNKSKAYTDVVEELIKKELKTRKKITVYNSIVVDDHSFDSFILEDNGIYDEVGYIHFKRDNNGKYEVIEIIKPDKVEEKAEGIRSYEFLGLKEAISLITTDDSLARNSIFLISNNPELDKIERVIDNAETYTIEVDTNPYIGFFEDLDVDNKIEYIFYNKEQEIMNLQDITKDKYTDKLANQPKENVNMEMVEFSSYARSNGYSEKVDDFDDLKDIYRIKSKYMIEDDWYIIGSGYFEIELLGHEEAKKVDFYISRLESGEGPILVFSDDDPKDGWLYSNNNIQEIIDQQRHPSSGYSFSYEPYFVIYADVSLKDGSSIRTPLLPIYNR